MGKDYNQYCDFVFLCKGSDCRNRGAKGVFKTFNKELKSLGLKKSTKIIETKCTGRCEDGPIVIIGQKWMTHVKSKEVKGIIAKNIKSDK